VQAAKHKAKHLPGGQQTKGRDMADERPIRILIADDHAIVRKGLRALLSTEQGIEVVGEAQNGREAIDLAGELTPDVILMDLMMPEVDGLQATEAITSQRPTTRILVLTSFAGDDKIFPAIRAGALGYLLKDSGPDELVDAIRQVYQGESALHPSVARKLLREMAGGNRQDPVDALTEREVEILQRVAQGLSNRQIADLLTISEATVRTHVSNILAKLHLDSRTQAALYALRAGIASLDDTE
jgi:two-component system, NarL family, response regulator LiaR